MNDHSSFEVSSREEAATALEYFNSFHDGFIKRLVIISQDVIEEDLGQTCSGVFDVEIHFSHYNYPPGGQRPFNQVVHAKFYEVQDVFCDFREGFLGNSISRLSIFPINRRRGATTTVEQCLALSLARNFYLEEYRRFELRESQMFTFVRAEFREEPAGIAP